jgi:hypothetical protein
MAKAQLALGVAVPGRGIEIANACCVRRLNGDARLRLWDCGVHIAETSPAHAELGDVEAGIGDLAGEVGV